MKEHFCTCTDLACPRHPKNHSHGCDPCMKDNIHKKKMPACMFSVVNPDTSDATAFTIEGFVDYFMKHQDTYLKNK